MTTLRKPKYTKARQQRHVDLEARQAAWMENKGERLTDDEIRELCDLRNLSGQAARAVTQTHLTNEGL